MIRVHRPSAVGHGFCRRRLGWLGNFSVTLARESPRESRPPRTMPLAVFVSSRCQLGYAGLPRSSCPGAEHGGTSPHRDRLRYD